MKNLVMTSLAIVCLLVGIQVKGENSVTILGGLQSNGPNYYGQIFNKIYTGTVKIHIDTGWKIKKIKITGSGILFNPDIHTFEGKKGERNFTTKVTFTKYSKKVGDKKIKVIFAKEGEKDVSDTATATVILLSIEPVANKNNSNLTLLGPGRICLNAQKLYKTATFKVSLMGPPGAYVWILSGNAKLSSHADFVEIKRPGIYFVKVDGSDVGEYAVRTQSIPLPIVKDTAKGDIFNFKMVLENSMSDEPTAHSKTGNMVVNGYNVSGASDKGSIKTGAFVSQNYKYKVITSPKEGLFNGKVEARAEVTHTPNASISAIAGKNENGAKLGISFNFGPVSFKLPGGGASNIAAGGGAGYIKFEDGGKQTTTGVEYSTAQIRVEIFDFGLFKAGGVTLTSISETKKDKKRIYVVGKTKYDLQTQIGIAAKTTKKWDQAANGASIISIKCIGKKPEIKEGNNVFKIQ